MARLNCLLIVVLLSAVPAFATVRTAATCASSDVQGAVNASTHGDTVRIPAGTCTWTSSVGIYRGITLQGAGEALTTIIDNIPKNGQSGSQMLAITVDAPNNIRLTGFTIKGQTPDSDVWNHGHIYLGGTMTAFRIDHISVTNPQTVVIRTGNCVFGLIDHITLTGGFKGLILHQQETCFGGTYGDGSWITPIGWGTAQAVYIEDSTFNTQDAQYPQYTTNIFDGVAGARMVIRNNRFKNGVISSHGADSSERYRGVRQLEVYNNVFEFPPEAAPGFVVWIRGGTGVVFNNTVNAGDGISVFVSLQNCRDGNSCGNGAYVPWGYCNGQSPYDGNRAGETGYPCVDQPGAGTSRDLKGINPPEPISVGQVMDPVYIWGNTMNSRIWHKLVAGTQHVQENRDYFVGTPRPNYKPYTYPHPLQGTSSADVTAPTPGASGTLSASNIGPNGLTLNWAKAMDDVSAQTELLYQVVRSSSGNIDTVASAEANGVVVLPYAANIALANVAGLNPSTSYFFNVIVKDAAGNKAVYALSSATTGANVTITADTLPPVPGGSGVISSGASATSAALNWAKASDNVTPQGALQYEVRLSTRGDIATVQDAENFGAIAVPYTTDINSATIPGWTPGATYYFNVIVRDGAGNKSAYAMQSATTVVSDSIAPTPGNGGLILAKPSPNSVTLSWNKASDNISLQGTLQYEVRRSNGANIDSVVDAEGNGIVVKAYTADLSTFTMTGLEPNATHYFNVIVKDAAGNKSSYAMRSVTTTTIAVPDTNGPIPGNSGLMTSLVTTNSVTLGWAKATDNISLQSTLEYEVRRSSSANIDTLLSAEANGVIVKPYTADINAFVVTGLNPGTTYYFNVIVRDGAGNKSAYLMRNAATTPMVDTIAPSPGGSGQITAIPNSNGVTLTWSKATDNVSSQPALRYEVRFSSGGNINDVAAAESNGTVAKAYTTDMSSFTVTGLNSGTLYYFNVIVIDQASNKAAYIMQSATTTGKKLTLNQSNNGRRRGPNAEIASLPDSSAPIPGANGLITVSGVVPNGLTLIWTRATDDLTTQAALQYKVLRSSTGNMNTVYEAETNGTTLIGFTENLNSYIVKNLTNASGYYYTVVVKDDAGNKAAYATAGDLAIRYSFLAEGEDSFSTASASSAALNVNQVRISPATDTAAPAGVAIVRFAPGGKLLSEGGFPLVAASRFGSAYVNIAASASGTESVSTGMAFSNSSGQSADISYSFVDTTGAEVKKGVLVLPANQQVSAFLNESPFFAPATFKGTFSYSSTAPVSAVGMRGITRSTGEFLFSSLPVTAEPPTGIPVLPMFVDGGGWSTEVVLMNRSSAPQHGTVQFFGQGSHAEPAPLVELKVNGETRSTFNYSIPPQSLVRFVTDSSAVQMANGSVRITSTTPETPASIPDVVGILSLRRDGKTVTESAIPAVSAGTAFRAYVEAKNGTQWVNTSLALVNTAGVPNVVSIQLMSLDGTPVGSVASVTLPAGGQISKFIRDLSANLPDQFQGVLRLTSTAPLGVSVFRCTYNAQGEFLYTPTPAVSETAASSTAALSFPMVATGAGYDTQLVLFGAAGQPGSGDLLFISKDGVPRTSASLGIVP